MVRTVHISVAGLTHTYSTGRGGVTAIEGLDLQVLKGEFLSVIGPSGGGKTTLLKSIGGLLAPTAGTVQIDGSSPEHAQRRKDIGFVFQDPSLLPWRTVLNNVMLPMQLNSGMGRDGGERAEELLARVRLSEYGDYYPHQLSAGMRQRVSLARALAIDPGILLMDEPLGALDDITRTAMRYEILRLWEGSRRTVVLVTHSIPEAIAMSDTVVVMSSRPGRVLEHVPIDLGRPRQAYLEHTSEFIEYADRIRSTLAEGAPVGEPALEKTA